jgi:hypothetical protein
MNHEPPESGNEADADEARDERGRVGGDADVAGGGEREAGSGAGAVDGCDHRLLEPADQPDVRVIRALQPLPDRAGRFLELLQVLAGAEAAAGARDHDRPHLVRGRLLQRFV